MKHAGGLGGGEPPSFKSALCVWGGWDGHEPEKCMAIFAEFLRTKGYRVEVSDSLAAYDDADKLAALDLIVQCWTMGKIERTQRENLDAAVRGGVGLAGWHGGIIDSFRSSATYQFMTGAQFVGHPGDIIDHTVNITRPDDPIMAGLQDFQVASEQYVMHVDPTNEVLATTTRTGEHMAQLKGCVMPVVYKRRWGKGRVFVSTLGHVAAEFDKDETRVLMERGLLWATR